MALLSSVFAQAALFFSSLTGAEVAKLTTENFDEFLKENPKTLVKFFAPWCGHCKSLAPHYEEASEKLPEGVKLAEVDATEEADLAQRFGVRGYPTMRWFDNGVDSEYDGGRTADTILQWVNVMTSDPVNAFDTIDAARKANDGAYLVVTSAKTDSAEYKIFEEVATSNRSLGTFIHITGDHSDSTAEELCVYRKGETTPQKITIAGVEKNELIKFVKFEKLPLFGNVNQETFPMYAETQRDFIWVAGSTEDKAGLAPVFEAFAKKYQEKYNVVYMDLVESSKQVEGMVGSSVYPVVAIMNETGPGRYLLHKEDFELEKIEKFVEQAAAGELKPTLKSEPIPESNDGPVIQIVGDNFDDVVTDDKDVLVKIYAPWCGHCKKMAPDYVTVGEQIAAAGSDIIIAEIDGTANEFANNDYGFKGFPTIYWKKANEKPVLYSGDRDVEGFMNFLKENSSKSFEYTPPASEESVGQDEL